MDSARAKTILIILFVALNIFLMVNVVSYTGGEDVSRQTLAYTKDFLSNRSISLQCAIPATLRYHDLLDYSSLIDKKAVASRFTGRKDIPEPADGARLENGSMTLEFISPNEIILTELSPGQPTADPREFSKYIRKLLKSLSLDSDRLDEDYAYEGTDGSITLRFTEKYKGYFIFDNFVEARRTASGMVTVKVNLDSFAGISRSNIIPAYQILIKNFSTEKPGSIKSIDFGFKGYRVDTDTKGSFDRPVWRVRMGDESIRYFKAFEGSDGGEISQSSLSQNLY